MVVTVILLAIASCAAIGVLLTERVDRPRRRLARDTAGGTNADRAVIPNANRE